MTRWSHPDLYPHVYVLADDEAGAVKIGSTGMLGSVERRVAALQAGNPRPLRLLGAAPGDRATERALHVELAQWRIHGEWFEATPEVFAAVERALKGGRLGPRCGAERMDGKACRIRVPTLGTRCGRHWGAPALGG